MEDAVVALGDKRRQRNKAGELPKASPKEVAAALMHVVDGFVAVFERVEDARPEGFTGGLYCDFNHPVRFLKETCNHPRALPAPR